MWAIQRSRLWTCCGFFSAWSLSSACLFVKVIGDSELAVNVSVNGWLSLWASPARDRWPVWGVSSLSPYHSLERLQPLPPPANAELNKRWWPLSNSHIKKSIIVKKKTSSNIFASITIYNERSLKIFFLLMLLRLCYTTVSRVSRRVCQQAVKTAMVLYRRHLSVQHLLVGPGTRQSTSLVFPSYKVSGIILIAKTLSSNREKKIR